MFKSIRYLLMVAVQFIALVGVAVVLWSGPVTMDALFYMLCVVWCEIILQGKGYADISTIRVL